MLAARTTARIPLLGLAYLGFVSLGMPDGLLGVGWPSIRSDFGVPAAAIGVLLGVGTGGYLLSSVAAGFAIARLGIGWLLAGSTGMTGLALTGYALAPDLPVLAGCGLLLGLGAGAIDSALNAYAAWAFGARHMNWLHASFGFGAMLGPLVMTSVLAVGLSWRWGYATVAVAQALLAAAFVATTGAWGTQEPASTAARSESAPDLPADRRRATLALPAVWIGALSFALYAGIELGAGVWAYTVLTEDRGLATAVAGVCVAGYWGSLFAGRLVFGVIAGRLGPGRVLTGSMLGMVVGALLIAVPAPAWVAVLGLVLIGGAAAPVFPLLTLTTADRVGAQYADRAIGVQVGAAAAGGAGLPAAIGAVIGRWGLDSLGFALMVLAVGLLALHVLPALGARANQG